MGERRDRRSLHVRAPRRTELDGEESLVSIPPPRRPGPWERLTRGLPIVLRTAGSIVPHATAAEMAREGLASGEVNWKSWDGPMAGKRRRLARAREHIDAYKRWSRQLRHALDQLLAEDTRRTELAEGRELSAQLDRACEQRMTARRVALELLGKDASVLADLIGFAEDEATMLATERVLRAGRLLSLAKARGGGVSGCAITCRAALHDMRGSPIPRGELPQILVDAPPERRDNFVEEVREEALRILERELDLLIRISVR